MYITTIVPHFKNKDQIISRILAIMPERELILNTDFTTYFHHLVESIVSQQLSVKASDTIFQRLMDIYQVKYLEPDLLLSTNPETLRSVGISWSKIKYISDLSNKVKDGTLEFENYQHISEGDIIRQLTQVVGIGQWTAEMFLIFTMGKLDVFSFGDQGLKQAFLQLYGKEANPKDPEVVRIIDRWTPYRSYASLALWHNLDNTKKKEVKK